ncbi:hypothetical protein MKX03_020051, partial [Papaver bracteatum]
MGFYEDSSTRSIIQIYHLGSNSWRTHGIVPYYFRWDIRRLGIISLGSLHWLVNPVAETYLHESPDVIVSFDICDEIFDELAFPDAVNNKDFIKEQELGVLDGCLCLLLRDPGLQVDFSVMREYG